MSHTLYLRLSSTLPEAHAEALMVRADGSIDSTVRSGTLAELCSDFTAERIVVLICGDEALVTRARLPKIGATKLRQSLPFALEDQLIGELDAQHFALGTPLEQTDADGTSSLDVPVVVIARRRLEEWLDTLRAAGITPSALYLEDSCVAAKPGDVLGWFRRDEILLRAPTSASCVTRLEDLAAALDVLLGDLPRQTLGLQLLADVESRRRGEAACATVAPSFARLTWIDSADTAVLPWLVSQLDLARPINLLQGEFAPRSHWSRIGPRWRLPAALAAALLILLAIDQGLAWNRAAQFEAALDAEILRVVSGVRPDLTSVDAVLAVVDSPAAQTAGVSLLQQGLSDLVAEGLPAESLRSVELQGSVLRVVVETKKFPATAAAGLTARAWALQATPAENNGTTLTMSRAPVAASADTAIARKQRLIAALPAALDRLQRRARLGEAGALPLASLATRLTDNVGVSATIDPATDGSVTLSLANVAFDSLLELQAEVRASDLSLREARIDAAGVPGRVQARLVLGPPRT